jgi:hypothetical protein
MPKIARWENFPEAVQQYLRERMRDRAIGIADLNQPRLSGSAVEAPLPRLSYCAGKRPKRRRPRPGTRNAAPMK